MHTHTNNTAALRLSQAGGDENGLHLDSPCVTTKPRASGVRTRLPNPTTTCKHDWTLSPPLRVFPSYATLPSRSVVIKIMCRAYTKEVILNRTNTDHDAVVYFTVVGHLYTLHVPACYFQEPWHETPLSNALNYRVHNSPESSLSVTALLYKLRVYAFQHGIPSSCC